MAWVVVKRGVGCQFDVPAAAQQTTFIVHEIRSNVSCQTLIWRSFQGTGKDSKKTF